MDIPCYQEVKAANNKGGTYVRGRLRGKENG